jgi:nucleotide-binding universal stress UspA family protein
MCDRGPAAKLPSMSDRPLLLCYDGSEDAKHAIREAASMFGPGRALVLSVWQDAAALPAFAWAGASLPDLEELFAKARAGAQRVAEEGAGIARATGLDPTPIVAEATGPIWTAVEEACAAHDVEAVVVGSRGLSGVKSILLGSVSNGIVHHATRPVVVVGRTAE